jgi:molybdenum cofactor cytidylyltransferase
MAEKEKSPVKRVEAVVLAAGLSTRMGTPKMALPWGKRTVVAQVVSQLLEGGADEVTVVTGGARELVEKALVGFPVSFVSNPDYANGEMLYSLQVGIRALGEWVDATLIALGDQPQIQASVVSAVIEAYQVSGAPLVIPSYHMRRGHPWLVERVLWGDLLEIEQPKTLRDFLAGHQGSIQYMNVEDVSILMDLDTPEEYQRQKPESGRT